MCRWNECVVAVLKHSDGKAIRESLGCVMEVSQNGVSEPPPPQEERHRPPQSEVPHADVFRSESNSGSGCLYDGAYGSVDFGTLYLLQFVTLLGGSNGGVSIGSVLVNVRHSETQGRHRTTLGTPYPSVPD